MGKWIVIPVPDGNETNEGNRDGAWEAHYEVMQSPSVNAAKQHEPVQLHLPDDDSVWNFPASSSTHDEFAKLFKTRASESLCHVYLADHVRHVSRDGKISSSLSSEVFSLLNLQFDVLYDYLGSQHLLNCTHRWGRRCAERVVQDVLQFLFRNLKFKQLHFRDITLSSTPRSSNPHDDYDGGTSVERCCAAANDFFRMTELAEELRDGRNSHYQRVLDGLVAPGQVHATSRRSSLEQVLRAELDELISLYGRDAVYAAQSSHSPVFEPIYQMISPVLFTSDWEDNGGGQIDVIHSVVHTIDDFLTDIEEALGRSSFLLKKALDAIVAATVVFYGRCLLSASQRRVRRKPSARKSRGRRRLLRSNDRFTFGRPIRAVQRMQRDIVCLIGYFMGLAKKSTMPALERTVRREFEVLVAFQEFMAVVSGMVTTPLFAGSMGGIDVDDFVFILHKHVGGHYSDTALTARVLHDLWHLCDPAKAHRAWNVVQAIEPSLRVLSAGASVASTCTTCSSSSAEGDTDDVISGPGRRADPLRSERCLVRPPRSRKATQGLRLSDVLNDFYSSLAPPKFRRWRRFGGSSGGTQQISATKTEKQPQTDTKIPCSKQRPVPDALGEQPTEHCTKDEATELEGEGEQRKGQWLPFSFEGLVESCLSETICAPMDLAATQERVIRALKSMGSFGSETSTHRTDERSSQGEEEREQDEPGRSPSSIRDLEISCQHSDIVFAPLSSTGDNEAVVQELKSMGSFGSDVPVRAEDDEERDEEWNIVSDVFSACQGDFAISGERVVAAIKSIGSFGSEA